MHFFLPFHFILFSERRWRRRTTLHWTKSAWKLCPIRYTPLTNYSTACVCVFCRRQLTSVLFLSPPDLGGLHQLSQRSVSVTGLSHARPHKSPASRRLQLSLLLPQGGRGFVRREPADHRRAAGVPERLRQPHDQYRAALERL